jgi:RPA family protein
MSVEVILVTTIMAQVKRETASICMVNDIIKGSFVKTEGWSPSYFAIKTGNVSRANVMGVVVSKDQRGAVLDDGTGRILLRSFDSSAALDFVEVGDFVTVIGRPRAYNDEKYILPEIVKKTKPEWAEFRKALLSSLKPIQKVIVEESRVVVSEEVEPTANYYQRILSFIRDLDLGEGASLEEVANRSGIPTPEVIIRRLLEEGEIFEIKPGRLKVLE